MSTLGCLNFRTVCEAKDRAGMELQYRPASLFYAWQAGTATLSCWVPSPHRLLYGSLCLLSVNLTYRVLLLQGDGIYCRTLLISEMGKENFQKFKPLTAKGMALCVDIGPKCKNLFRLV